MNYFVHVANVLFLASYLVRDILWLRFLTIVAGTALLPYYFANDLHAPIAWNAVFILINILQVKVLLLERRPVTMTEQQERIYQTVFRALRPREFLKLFQLATPRMLDDGAELVAQGEALDRLLLIEAGTTAVEVDGRAIARVGAGRFVGEMSYLTGEQASASVRASGAVQLFEWPRDTLEQFLAKQPEIRSALQLVIGTDLASKLKTA